MKRLFHPDLQSEFAMTSYKNKSKKSKAVIEKDDRILVTIFLTVELYV
ncbi:MAG: hypothetical protein H6587_04485 [Flavobacteriales bacterium]|nr:hypothetical protein [Flavobacteriales bacterium]